MTNNREVYALSVVNNVFGALYSKGFDVVYTKIMDKINNKNDDDNFGSLNASM